ncbi:hypothetical protein KBK24_0120190 [Burkholderia sp. K24]|nr:hypothetical protein AC233_10980 [Burkholderia sp. HB1]KFX63992.1 hypothetical protein KBK24_0120190 [Burkholderia sp. K24]
MNLTTRDHNDVPSFNARVKTSLFSGLPFQIDPFSFENHKRVGTFRMHVRFVLLTRQKAPDHYQEIAAIRI